MSQKLDIMVLLLTETFILQECNGKGKQLENLATVMTLYSRRNFSKESFQWTKCVVKYLHDIYATLAPNLMAFLVEVIIFSQDQVQLYKLFFICFFNFFCLYLKYFFSCFFCLNPKVFKMNENFIILGIRKGTN